MRLEELSKSELCELVKRLLRHSDYITKHTVRKFLLERWQKKYDELIEQWRENIGCEQYAEWCKIQTKINRLEKNEDYYLELEELKGGEE